MYQVSEKHKEEFEKLIGLPQVQEALSFIEVDEKNTLEEQKELVLIEAPTFQESVRANVIAERFTELGLENVHIDRGGNVVGLKKGKNSNFKILIEGHLDTVFPMGSVKEVVEKDGFIYAPGIGDDTRALAMMLGLLRAFNQTKIETIADLVFVATTREEGAGSLGGMKDFLQDNTDIDLSLSIDNNDMSMIVYEATCGETWEVTFLGEGGHAYGAFGKIAHPLHAAARVVAKISDFEVPEDPKTTFCVSNFHGGTAAGVHAIPSEVSIKFNFRSNSQVELDLLRNKIFGAIEDGVKEECDKWKQNEITWKKEKLGEVPGGTQDVHIPLVEFAFLGLSHLGIEPVFAKGGCTNANVAVAKKIPALCMGRAFAPDEESKNILNHSLEEKFPIAGSYKAVQQVLMVLLLAAGIDKELDSIIIKE